VNRYLDLAFIDHAFIAFIASASLLLINTAQATPSQQTDWQLIKDSAHIRSYKKVQTGTPLLAYKAISIIEAPLPEVLSVLLDPHNSEEWIPRLLQSSVLDAKHWPKSYVQFTQFDAPWPVTDRFFLSKVEVKIDPKTYQTEIHYFNSEINSELKHELKAVLAPQSNEQPSVRGSAGGSHYILKPADHGQNTEIIAISVADPNGAIPKWLVNWIGKNMPHNTMKQLQDRVAERKQLVIPEIAQLYPDLITH
jgi:hypothetical protein